MVPPDSAASEVPGSQKRKHKETAVSHPLEGTTAPELLPSKKSKQEDLAEESAAATDSKAPNSLRFREGQSVLCNLSKKSNGFLWKAGTVASVSHKMENGDIVPYIVELENGNMAGSPEDDDECIRLAARACLDMHIMRVFALPQTKTSSIRLGFAEGDRVAVQLDLGIWEEGVVIEVWTAPERNRKPFKTWAGVAVPYAVRLDLGDIVMVPFDSEEVIRAESAPRPPQKSIAEQLGGTERNKPGAGAGKRFIKRQNAELEWVIVDSRTGFERACPPPSSVDV